VNPPDLSIFDESYKVSVFHQDSEALADKLDCHLDPVTQIWTLKPEFISKYFPVLEPAVPVIEIDWNDKTVRELKAEAMLKASALGHRKSWIQTTSKEALVEYMQTGKIPDNGGLAQVLQPAPHPAAVPVSGDLASLLAAAIAPFLGNLTSKVDESDVIRIVEERLESFRAPKLIQVLDLQGNLSVPDCQHQQFEKLLRYVSQRQNVYLVGPAASGKTQVAENIARHLGLEFSSISVCSQTAMSAFFGFMNAVGDYVTTEFRKRYEKGGVFLLDEFDNGNANTAAAINQATANSVCAFPDGMVKKHPDFVCICAGNTYGTGADRQYVGRNQLDAATLDRFAFVVFDYDEELEMTIGPVEDWTRHVQKIRHAVDDLKIRHVVSMRATLNGGRMLKAGLPWTEVEQEYIWKGLERNEVAKIVSHLAKKEGF
jgi:MoxR-like ATPase